MTDRPAHDVSYELGGIKQQLETITRTLSENRSADAQYRTGIREEMGKQRDAISEVNTKVTITQRDISDTKQAVDEIKPKLKSLEDRALMSKGAANFAIAVGKVGHVIMAALGGIVALLIERWMRGSPH